MPTFKYDRQTRLTLAKWEPKLLDIMKEKVRLSRMGS